MMSNILISDTRRGVGPAVTLAVQDSLDVTLTGNIIVDAGAGVVGLGQNTLKLDGDVMSLSISAAISLGGGNNVAVNGTSLIYGSSGFISGGATNIINSGQIIATRGYGLNI